MTISFVRLNAITVRRNWPLKWMGKEKGLLGGSDNYV